MQQNKFLIGIIILEFVASWWIFTYIFGAPDDKYGLNYIYHGGPLVIVLMALFMMNVTFVIERFLSLAKAQGKGSLSKFVQKLQRDLMDGNVDAAIESCNQQRGSLANIVRAGLERYKSSSQTAGSDKEKVAADTKLAIEEATMLEVPLLERNLVALSTIASISTMIGLLGTTLGMIRAFRALAKGGAPDAVQLSMGISEALINTAGGLAAAIIGIVFYNYFTTKVDGYVYAIDEASYTMIETLTGSMHKK